LIFQFAVLFNALAEGDKGNKNISIYLGFCHTNQVFFYFRLRWIFFCVINWLKKFFQIKPDGKQLLPCAL